MYGAAGWDSGSMAYSADRNCAANGDGAQADACDAWDAIRADAQAGLPQRVATRAHHVGERAPTMVSTTAMSPRRSAGAVQSIFARVRPLLRWAWIYLLFLTGSIRRAKRNIGRRGGIVVITLHRVLSESQDATTCSLRGMRVREETFEALAGYLSAHYQVVPLNDEAPVWRSGQRQPQLALTFDDGWSDNATTLAPIARKYGIPHSIFICPSKVGARLPFWPEQVAALLKIARASEEAIAKVEGVLTAWVGPASVPDLHQLDALEPLVELLKSRPTLEREEIIGQLLASVGAKDRVTVDGAADSTMSWADIRSLHEAGVVFGSHTQSHQLLTGIAVEEARCELADSREEIEKRLASRCVLFSYPNGDWSLQVRALVGGAGYRFAFTNQPGAWTRECDPLLIPRVNIWEEKLVGPSGSFSPIAFEYATFWKAHRAERQRLLGQRDEGVTIGPLPLREHREGA